MKPRTSKLPVFVLLAIAATTWLTDSALCQKKNLRWSLKEGERLLLEIQQRSRTTRTFKNNELVVAHDTTMQIEWHVTSIGENGAEVTQTFRAIKMSMDTPNAKGVEFDTASDKRPSGNAKILSSAIKPLIGTPVKLQLNGRGEVIAASLSDEASQAIKHAIASMGAPGLLSTDGMQKMLNQSIFKLPESPVAKGEQWKDEVVIDLPARKLTTQHNYTYLGEKETEQGAYDSIGVVTNVQVEKKGEDGSDQKRDFTHQQSGEMLFDSTAGRPVSSNVTQSLTSSRTIGGLEVKIISEANSTMTIKPLKTATLEK